MSSIIQTARFRLSQLLPWASQKAGESLSVAGAIDYYLNWCLRRGWRLCAAEGMQVREPEIIYARDFGGDKTVLMRDELWSVIWQSECAEGGVDFLAEYEAMRAEADRGAEVPR